MFAVEKKNKYWKMLMEVPDKRLYFNHCVCFHPPVFMYIFNLSIKKNGVKMPEISETKSQNMTKFLCLAEVKKLLFQ